MKAISIFFCGALFVQSLQAQQIDLFELTRTLNRNKVVYSVTVGESGFTGKNPVKARWEMVEKGGKTESLTALEARKAYGVIVYSVKPDEVVFSLKAQPSKKISVRWITEKEVKVPKAIIVLNGVECALSRVHLVLGKGGILPAVNAIEFHGVDLQSGQTKVVTENPRS